VKNSVIVRAPARAVVAFDSIVWRKIRSIRLVVSVFVVRSFEMLYTSREVIHRSLAPSRTKPVITAGVELEELGSGFLRGFRVQEWEQCYSPI
jgi:hypothetical protein